MLGVLEWPEESALAIQIKKIKKQTCLNCTHAPRSFKHKINQNKPTKSEIFNHVPTASKLTDSIPHRKRKLPIPLLRFVCFLFLYSSFFYSQPAPMSKRRSPPSDRNNGSPPRCPPPPFPVRFMFPFVRSSTIDATWSCFVSLSAKRFWLWAGRLWNSLSLFSTAVVLCIVVI